MGNGKYQLDRSQVIGEEILIGQLAPWVTWDIWHFLWKVEGTGTGALGKWSILFWFFFRKQENRDT